MAEQPIGITFMPSAEAAANGPRQASAEGQGGSDLAQAFKILSLHLPRVLGAAAIAPKRLLTSPGSAGITGGGGGFNPYAAVFQSLLHSLTGGSQNAPGDVSSLVSLFGDQSSPSGPSVAEPSYTSSDLAPKFTPADDPTRTGIGDPLPDPPAAAPSMPMNREPRQPRDRYL